jgi:Zn-finger nucleic acid-binding protein
MKCPCCPDTALLISERQGIEIDYCPQCRGVWLDRGELDKLIERASQVTPGQTAARPAAPPQGYTAPPQGYTPPPQGYPPPQGQGYYHKKHKPSSWLSELFD